MEYPQIYMRSIIFFRLEPAVTSLSPNAGSVSGGSMLVIYGRG